MNFFKKIAAVVLSLCMLATLSLTGVFADDTLYEVKDSDTLSDINTALADTAYEGIVFPEGMTKTYDGTLQLKDRALTVKASGGSTITFAPTGTGACGILLSNGADATFSGSGVIVIDGTSSRGLQCGSGTDVTINAEANLIIRNTTGYGLCNEGSASVFTSYGNITIDNCGVPGEGGFIWDYGSINFLGGTTTITNSDSTGFVSFYMQSETPVIVENSTLQITSKNFDSALTLLSTMTIGTGGKVDISMNNTTEQRGINGTGSLEIKDNGILNITGNGNVSPSYGIRGINVTINEGELNISGVETGVTSRSGNGSFTAYANSKVTIDADTQFGVFPTAPVIDGGSIQLVGKTAITNAIKADTIDQISDQQPVNTNGISLSLFLLSNYTESSFEAGGITYSVKDNHDGTAYVWAPEIEVTFFDINDDSDSHKIGDSLYGIDGQSLNFVNGSAPADPTNPIDSTKVFIGWYLDKEYTREWSPDMALTADTGSTGVNIYAKYGDPVYTVTYDSQGGSTVTGDQDGWNIAENGKTLYKPDDPTRDGYTFNGWYLEADCINAFDHSEVLDGITGNFTLYAKWTKNDVAPTETDPSSTQNSTPSTGDSYKLPLFATLAVLSVCGFGMVAIKRKKKESK